MDLAYPGPVDEEIDTATWRRYQYRVRQYAVAGKQDIWGAACPDCFDSPGACSACQDACPPWAARNHQDVAQLSPVSLDR